MAGQGSSMGAWALPRLGLGTWAWGDRETWRFDRSYGLAEVEGAFQASWAEWYDYLSEVLPS